MTAYSHKSADFWHSAHWCCQLPGNQAALGRRFFRVSKLMSVYFPPFIILRAFFQLLPIDFKPDRVTRLNFFFRQCSAHRNQCFRIFQRFQAYAEQWLGFHAAAKPLLKKFMFYFGVWLTVNLQNQICFLHKQVAFGGSVCRRADVWRQSRRFQR